MNSTVTTGFTEQTTKHLLLDAGAVYKNYGLPTEDLVGATSGGSEFDVKVKTRQIAVDGIKAANAKGLQVIDSYTTTLKANFLEMTEDILCMALIGTIDTSNADYDVITSKAQIGDEDYIDNVALVTTISGSGKPVVIILKNALSLDGLQLKTEDSKDNVLPVTFTASADPQKPQEIPYEIHYPKDVAAAPQFFLEGSPIIDNGKVLLTLTDTVAASVPATGFAVKVAGTADVITGAARGVNALNTIVLTLTTAPTSGQAVTVAYAVPTDTTKQITSASGATLAAFDATTVINN